MRAKRSLGQNFLQDGLVIDRIVAALDLNGADTVIEIGPGRGALTEHLIERAERVIAIEFDRDMTALLRDRFGNTLQVVEADVLNVDLRALVSGTCKLVGNLPYNISTPILAKLIEVREMFSTLVLMFQREVVDRITAKAGTDRGYLSVLAEAAFQVERLFDVPPTAFRPVPKVWSAVVRFMPTATSVVDDQRFRSLVSWSFMQKRKTLLNNLKGHLPAAAELLEVTGIDSGRRAETLILDEWQRLFSVITKKKPDIDGTPGWKEKH